MMMIAGVVKQRSNPGHPLGAKSLLTPTSFYDAEREGQLFRV